MALYSKDLSEYPVGALDFTNDWLLAGRYNSSDAWAHWACADDAAALGGKIIQGTRYVDYSMSIGPRDWPVFADGEMLVKMRVDAPPITTSVRVIGAYLRTGISANDQESYGAFGGLITTTAYGEYRAVLGCRGPGGDKIYTTTAVAIPGVTVGSWVWARFRAVGTLMQLRVWLDGDPEPVAWTVEQTETDDRFLPLAPGYAAFGSGSIAPLPAWSLDFASISNDPAESAPGGRVFSPPTAVFSAVKTLRTVAVDASASSDSDGTIASYDWDWGDGSAHGSGVTANHAYALGSYTITLTVTDNDGQTDTATSPVVISNAAPVASVAGSVVSRTVSVDGSASSDPDGTIASYDWNWGDGTAHGSGATAQHTYLPAGTYTVTLTVTDNDGGTGTATYPAVIANLAPTAALTASVADRTVSVNGSASSDPDGTIASYDWNWGDGSAHGSGATAQHTYAAPGTFTITLTVTDNEGGTDAATQVVASSHFVGCAAGTDRFVACPDLEPFGNWLDAWAIYLLDEQPGDPLPVDVSGKDHHGLSFDETVAALGVGDAERGADVVEITAAPADGIYPVRVYPMNNGTDEEGDYQADLGLYPPTLYAAADSYVESMGGLREEKAFTLAFWAKPDLSAVMSFVHDKRGYPADGESYDRLLLMPMHGANDLNTDRTGWCGSGVDVGANGFDVWAHAHNYVWNHSYWKCAPASVWRHYVVVIRRGPYGIASYLYVDGVHAGDHPDTVDHLDGVVFYGWLNGYTNGNMHLVTAPGRTVGNDSDLSAFLALRPYAGALSEYVIFDRALTDTEIAELYARPAYDPATTNQFTPCGSGTNRWSGC